MSNVIKKQCEEICNISDYLAQIHDNGFHHEYDGFFQSEDIINTIDISPYNKIKTLNYVASGDEGIVYDYSDYDDTATVIKIYQDFDEHIIDTNLLIAKWQYFVGNKYLPTVYDYGGKLTITCSCDKNMKMYVCYCVLEKCFSIDDLYDLGVNPKSISAIKLESYLLDSGLDPSDIADRNIMFSKKGHTKYVDIGYLSWSHHDIFKDVENM